MNENQNNQNTKYSSYNNSQCCDPKDLIHPALTENLTINWRERIPMKHLRWWLISPNRYSKSISARLWFIFIHEDSFVDALTQVFLLSILLSTKTKRSIWYLINLKWKYTCNYTLLECKALFHWCKKKWSCYHLRPLLLNFQN